MAASEAAAQAMSFEKEDKLPTVSKELDIKDQSESPNLPTMSSPQMRALNGETWSHHGRRDHVMSMTDGNLITGSQSPVTESEKSEEPEEKDNNDRHTQSGDSIEGMEDEKLIEQFTDQRTKDAKGKVADYVQYIQCMEARVTSLEATMQKATGIEDKLKQAEISTERLPVIPELRRVTWNEFKHRTKGDKTIYAIEALAGEAKYYYQQAQERKTVAKLSINRGPLEQRDPVLRIRINSVPVLSILADITDVDWSMEPTVLLYPFKILARHATSIRETLKRLESTWDSPGNEAFFEDSKETSSADGQEATTGSILKHPVTEASNNGTAVNAPMDSDCTTSETEAKNEGVNSRDVPDIISDTNKVQEKLKPDDVADSPEALKDLRCLVQFMDEELAPVIEKVNDPSRTRVHFRDLWHLFKPGDEVFVPRMADKAEAGYKGEGLGEASPIAHRQNERSQEDWRILNVGGGRRNLTAGDDDDDEFVPNKKPNSFYILCYHIDFDGQKFIVVRHPFIIKPFDGEREITSLEVYPPRLLKNHRERRAGLKERGEKFKEFTAFKHMMYKGPTLNCHPCGCSYDDKTSSRNVESIDSHVVVDFHEAISNSNFTWSPWRHSYTTIYGHGRELRDDVPVSIWRDSDRKELHEKKNDLIYYDSIVDNEMALSFEASDPMLREDPDPSLVNGTALREEDLILLPSRVLAFVFRNRKFAALHINHLRPVKPNKKGWSDLKLPSGHKEMLKALITNHLHDKEQSRPSEDKENQNFDLVRGKGQGLVVLLHGVPGVGKTSTAECIAETHSKPLFPITCGDLGLTADSVERELATKFHLAQTWDCVLLLDEADVFLAARTREDIKRNALVSVFLRVLEYYTGILFLTTNRIGAFDGAFKSRIHLPLYFPPLDEDQTLSIWKVNLKRTLKRKGGMMTTDKNDILSFAKSQYKVGMDARPNWNGRQIRNAFQTAAAFAEYEAQKAEDSQIGPGPKRAVQARLHSGHFKVVADASLLFDVYLNDIDDNTEMERNDDFDQVATFYGESKQAKGVYRPSVPQGAQGSRKYTSATHTFDDQGIRHPGFSPSVQSMKRNPNTVIYRSHEAPPAQIPFKPRRKTKHTESDSAQTVPSSRSKQTSAPTPGAPNPKYSKQPEANRDAVARKEAFVESKRRQLAPQNQGSSTIAAVREESESDDDSEDEFTESDKEQYEEE